MISILKSSSKVACIFSLLMLCSCSTKGGRSHYVLTATGPAPSYSGLGLGIGPVSLAPYLLERPSLVFQSSANKLEFSEDHLWAGELEGDFARVLATNLGRRMGTGNVKTYPWVKEGELDYQITVDVIRFHGTPDGETVLEANWRAYRLPAGNLVASRNSTVRDDLQADGFEELAASQSRLIDLLAEVISEEL